MAEFKPVLLRHRGQEGSTTIDFALKHGAYEQAKRVLKDLKPAEVIDTVKASGLRGRGGAGFPCGMKWGFVPKDSAKPKYLVVNADESEPGTFKDRVLIETDPHALLEGTIISAYAIDAHVAYIYIRGEFVSQAKILEKAIAEAREKGFIGKNIFGSGYDLQVTVHRGAGAYICGEETGLLSSIEGGRGCPKIKPPFPAVEGLFRCPTIINNVETLMAVPPIMANGPDWFKQWGNERNAGFKVYGLSGHVNKPGAYELPLCIPVRELVYDHGGGIPNGRTIKAVIPGGASSGVLTADELDTPMDFDTLMKMDLILGTACACVLDETVCMVDALWNCLRFFHHESCGQCTPCREGTGWLEKMVAKIEKGEGKKEYIDLIDEVAGKMRFKTICALADAAAIPAQAFVKRFRAEFEQHIEEKRCPLKTPQPVG
jgi:NADH-quinone oxidoreductase subunit F